MSEQRVETATDKMLAAMYPDNAHADAAPPADEQEPESAQEPQEDEVIAEDQSEENAPPPDASEATDDAGEGETDDSDGEEPDTDEVALSTLDQLAEHLETDPDYLQGLTVRQKINGQEVDVAIADALATHRKVTAADSYLTEAKAKRSEILQEANAQKETIGETAAVFGTMLKDLKDAYTKQSESIDWAGLRADDPAEYAAKKQEFSEMQERIGQFEQRGKQAYQEYAKSLQEQQQRQMQERLPEEYAKLEVKLPEWKDSEKASQERKAVAEYLYSEGLTEKEVEAAAYNATVLSMAVKAMRYDKAQGKKQVAKKKVLKIPKVTKPGTKPEASSKPKPASDDRASILYG
jgi:hypothetical protein